VQGVASFGKLLAMPEAPDPNKKSMSTADIVRYSEIGFIIPAAVIVGLICGMLLDKWLGTHWIYIAGVIFGAIVGFIQLIRMVLKAEKKIET
jgi:F0F1-type ATP synthase assembly protein I